MSPASYHHKKTNNWPKISLVKVRGEKSWMVDARQSIKGKAIGRRFFFETQALALKHADELRKERALSGIAVHGALPGVMTEAERIDCLEALNLLRPLRCSLFEAAQLAKAHLERRRVYHSTPTIEKAWSDYIEQKTQELARGEFRKKSLTSVSSTGRRLILPAWKGRRLESINTPDVQKWINSIPGSAHTRRDAKTVFGQLMNFSRAQGWISANPAEPVTVKVPVSEPSALTPQQAARLLAACRKHENASLLVPYLAVSLLAGLRPGEVEQLDWKDVNLSTSQIQVRPQTSKGGRSRFVDLIPEALALLTPHRRKGGLIIGDQSVSSWTNVWKDARGRAGFRFGSGKSAKGGKWPADVLRHTFATYWLTRNADRNKLADQMGNSVAVINRHYRRAVPKAEGEAFWAIFNTA